MDYKKLLKQIFEGSRAQRKRYKKDGLTDALQAKLIEGNRNSLRTITVRLFFLYVQNHKLYKEIKEVKSLMQEFHQALFDKDIKTINKLIKQYEEKSNVLANFPAKNKRNKSYVMQAQIILTATILLFKETKDIPFKKELCSEENRYNPLNPFFPFKIKINE